MLTWAAGHPDILEESHSCHIHNSLNKSERLSDAATALHAGFHSAHPGMEQERKPSVSCLRLNKHNQKED